jgi:hypothetical protein
MTSEALTVVPLPGQVSRRSRGDARVWLAPRCIGEGAVPVLRFTDAASGRGYAVQLSDADLVNIHETALAILAASPETVEAWLDQAAEVVMKAVAAQRKCDDE